MRSLRQTDRWGGRIGFRGKVELGVICIAVEMNAVPTEDITNGEEMKRRGAQDRTLEHT